MKGSANLPITLGAAEKLAVVSCLQCRRVKWISGPRAGVQLVGQVARADGWKTRRGAWYCARCQADVR